MLRRPQTMLLQEILVASKPLFGKKQSVEKEKSWNCLAKGELQNNKLYNGHNTSIHESIQTTKQKSQNIASNNLNNNNLEENTILQNIPITISNKIQIYKTNALLDTFQNFGKRIYARFFQSIIRILP